MNKYNFSLSVLLLTFGCESHAMSRELLKHGKTLIYRVMARHVSTLPPEAQQLYSQRLTVLEQQLTAAQSRLARFCYSLETEAVKNELNAHVQNQMQKEILDIKLKLLDKPI